MATEDGRYVISYNGEVFNFELRIELEALGWHFRSRTDSEVVLKAVAQWGRDALSRFNGQFAFAVWDRVARRLLLGRDRYGIKPVYVRRTGNTLIFGSEIKAILRHPGAPLKLTRKASLSTCPFRTSSQSALCLRASASCRPARGCLWVRTVKCKQAATGISAFQNPIRYRLPARSNTARSLIVCLVRRSNASWSPMLNLAPPVVGWTQAR